MNRAFLDDRSGDKWDLFFAGVSGYARMEEDAIELSDPYWSEGRDRSPRGSGGRRSPSSTCPALYLNPTKFREVEEAVAKGHQRALATAEENREPWHYSGATDLVSFMVYHGEPDWLSLLGVRLDMPLGELTEGFREWEVDDLDPDLAPGGVRYTGGPLPLAEALWGSAKTVVGGVLGNTVYELLRHIAR